MRITCMYMSCGDRKSAFWLSFRVLKRDEKMKNSSRILVVIIVILSLSTWSAFADGAKYSTSTTGDGAIKVALLVPGPINDQGWSESAYIGLKEHVALIL